jgi:hypothetical protein
MEREKEYKERERRERDLAAYSSKVIVQKSST